MFHRTPLLLLHYAPLTRQASGNGGGLEGEEDGDWGRREGGGEWHKNSSGWSTHCVCSTRLDRTRARAAAARLGDRRRRCESSFRALALTRRAGSGDAFMLRNRVHSR